MLIHPREFYPARKTNVPQLHKIRMRMHLTYLNEYQDQGNRKSNVWFYLFKIWNQEKWIPAARDQRSGSFEEQKVARKEHGGFKATW